MRYDDAAEEGASSRSESDDESLMSHKQRRQEAEEEDKYVDTITGNETRAVSLSKLMAFLVLLSAAVSMGLLTYMFVRNDEVRNFRQQYDGYVDEIIQLTNNKIVQKASAIEGLATEITSYTYDKESMTWPNITLPDFDLRIKGKLVSSGAKIIIFAPFVSETQKDSWEHYANTNQGWIRQSLLREEGIEYTSPGMIPREMVQFQDIENAEGENSEYTSTTLFSTGVRVPLWQMGPTPINASRILLDLATLEPYKSTLQQTLELRSVVISKATDMTQQLDLLLEGRSESTENSYEKNAYSLMLVPVFESFEVNAPVVGVVGAALPWNTYFKDILPFDATGVVVNVEDSCGGSFTYVINGLDAQYFGQGDLHDPKYDGLRRVVDFSSILEEPTDKASTTTRCKYHFVIYPSDDLRAQFVTHQPWLFAIFVVCVFIFTAMIFMMYDYLVQRRQAKLVATATRTNTIVASLFPVSVRDRILAEAKTEKKSSSDTFKCPTSSSDEMEKAYSSDFDSKPIADLFPEVTVLFADIVGFTAWSCMRDPAQVFELLETIYHAFDQSATRRRVFKVETIGDCYVAAVGLPDIRKDHAVVMARFARDCIIKMSFCTKQLEVRLGPDTGELGIRIGLHSGPVTAGVLRGQRARFQLFGDTVNTTARIETTGEKNRIHISEDTARILRKWGKSHWVTPRSDTVSAKGKGVLSTFWLELKGESATSTSHSGSMQGTPIQALVDHIPEAAPAVDICDMESLYSGSRLDTTDIGAEEARKTARLVNWATEMFRGLLEAIIRQREKSGILPCPPGELQILERCLLRKKHRTIEEVSQFVVLAKNIGHNQSQKEKNKDVKLLKPTLEPEVISQLHRYISTVAAMYRNNAFHNFEHASHVTMSTVKLLTRVTTTCNTEDPDQEEDDACGITNDPLTTFSLVFAALIHDVDHSGVSNAQLVKETAPLAVAYDNKSAAEQNSVDLAWELLMDENFYDLRRTIYTNKDEFRRFRQAVVNAVLSTDLMDKELKELRNMRWELAFSERATDDSTHNATLCERRATVVLDHLIQASDVCHTMQHWHIYRKWNERLFIECHDAYKSGRAETDPAIGWFEGELNFFDKYVIPLAQKLGECGVFGVSPDELLNYAINNRREWASKGREEVAAMVARLSETRCD